MSHFMMYGNQVFVIDTGTHFNSIKDEEVHSHISRFISENIFMIQFTPVVLTITKIPCRWLTYDDSVGRLFQNGINPKFRRQYGHIHRQKEFFGQLKHDVRCISLGSHLRCYFKKTSAGIRDRYVENIGPTLPVHVAENVIG